MSLNFEKYQAEANEWLNKVTASLGIQDRNRAGRIFRAVLHALRDRLPAEEAVHLGAQLPIVWKGVYFDGFKLGTGPVRIRNEEDWLQFIRTKDSFAEAGDFPTLYHAKLAFDDVMLALRGLLSPGQYEKIENALHTEIRPKMAA